jgi:hypothetical protein
VVAAPHPCGKSDKVQTDQVYTAFQQSNTNGPAGRGKYSSQVEQ